MSEENVERWRALIEQLLAASGESDLQAWVTRTVELLDPEVEWDASEVPVPDLAGVFRGKEAVIQWWREWLAAWDTVAFDYELLDAGDRVLLLVDQRMRGRTTGIEVELGKYAQLATFRDGLITHYKIYSTQAEALEAAGLRE
jgi:ketosteroid isomerase-like protein